MRVEMVMMRGMRKFGVGGGKGVGIVVAGRGEGGECLGIALVGDGGEFV